MAEQAPSPEIEVRLLQREDFDAVVLIDASVSGNSRPDYYKKRFAAALDAADHMVISLVAEWDGRVVGFIMGDLFLGEFGIPEATASVDTIGVDPGYQHHGVGRVLIEDFVRNARVAGVKKIYTRVLWNDLALIRFFDSVGFVPGRMINLELAVD